MHRFKCTCTAHFVSHNCGFSAHSGLNKSGVSHLSYAEAPSIVCHDLGNDIRASVRLSPRAVVEHAINSSNEVDQELSDVSSAHYSLGENQNDFYSQLHDTSNELGMPVPRHVLKPFCLAPDMLRFQNSLGPFETDLIRQILIWRV